MPQCTAKSKRSGERCRQWAMHGMTVCYMHGGASHKSIGTPRLKHGRYSKYLPKGLLPRYEEQLDDAGLLGMRDEIALLDARTSDLLARLTSGGTDNVWKMLAETWGTMTEAMAAGEPELVDECLRTVGELIRSGDSDRLVWEELRDVMGQRKTLVESERQRLVQEKQVITVQQALIMVQFMLDSVRRNVSDRDALDAIAGDFARLTGRSSTRRTDGVHAGGEVSAVAREVPG